ncbi:MAG TPA: response regulator [Planctomycetota bacterium]|nr:response regulator [Planctomycetota bacterium]
MSDPWILVVDDNDDDVELTKRAFRKCGFTQRLEIARDGVAALARLCADGVAQPAFVLLDLNMPRINGIEVVQRLRGDPRTRAIPIIVLTSSREPSDLAGAYAAGANSYVRKPIEFDRFVEVVRQIGGYWLSLNEPAPREPAA